LQVPTQLTLEICVPGGQSVLDPPQQLHSMPSTEQYFQ
jgi:hypothetical protein